MTHLSTQTSFASSLVKNLLAVILFCQSFSSFAATIEGLVHDADGKPVAQVLVSLANNTEWDKHTISQTTYTNNEGKFSLNVEFEGSGVIRARHYLFKDYFSKVINIQKDKNDPVNIIISPYMSLPQLAEELPASSYYLKLHEKAGVTGTELTSQCTYCHQLGNKLTRNPRSLTEWEGVVERMEGMGSLLTFGGAKKIPKLLSETFNGDKAQSIPEFRLSGAEPKAQITEWRLGEATSYIHDIAVHPNGNIYGVDMSLDFIYELNPSNGSIKNWPLPKTNGPLGGRLSGAYRPLGSFNAYHGPHSLQIAPDGLVWTTNSLSGELHSFDPKTGEFQRFPIKGGVYPHTLRFDQKGRIWFTMALSNQIGLFDPKSQEMKLLSLPSYGVFQWVSAKLIGLILDISAWWPQKNYHVKLSTHKLSGLGAETLPLPYGIDINPQDGSIWYSKLYSSQIGHIDPETLKIEEIDSPLKAPRRLRFSKDGSLWIPSFLGSALMKLDTKTKEFKKWNLPVLAKGQIETPYALNIHPQTQEVWVTAGASDRIISFDPKNEEFTSFPLPTRVTFMREIDFTEKGTVCTSYSNLPAYAIEGGTPKVVCLQKQ